MINNGRLHRYQCQLAETPPAKRLGNFIYRTIDGPSFGRRATVRLLDQVNPPPDAPTLRSGTPLNPRPEAYGERYVDKPPPSGDDGSPLPARIFVVGARHSATQETFNITGRLANNGEASSLQSRGRTPVPLSSSCLSPETPGSISGLTLVAVWNACLGVALGARGESHC